MEIAAVCEQNPYTALYPGSIRLMGKISFPGRNVSVLELIETADEIIALNTHWFERKVKLTM
jgi:hypothetical protein